MQLAPLNASIDPNSPLQRATGIQSAGNPETRGAIHSGALLIILPLARRRRHWPSFSGGGNKEPESVVFFLDWVVAVVMYIGALSIC
jgi:hypothetical protein